MSLAPGTIRDSIVNYLSNIGGDAPLVDISKAVAANVGKVPASSIRSYLNLNVPDLFERTERGRYRLKPASQPNGLPASADPVLRTGLATLFQADCFDWLAGCEAESVHAVVTDPPYGLREYTSTEQDKLRRGRGGVWRIPPSFDGHKRAPLPRFTILDAEDHAELHRFFRRLGNALLRAAVPGANVLVASNPLLAHIVAQAMCEAGLELRGTIVRLTMTMRGGDRPKNAHTEFDEVSVMPRSMWEPWVVLRKPLHGRVQDNLRKWNTGGFRRPCQDRPFGDVIRSSPTPRSERLIAPHPSLKPQAFLRQIVRAALPMGEGIVLDPFAGSGSTLAAATAVGYRSIGVESDPHYVGVALSAVERLGSLRLADPV
ncbi:MAG TPA: DNA methyltransferase [Acetobacteraceae bacterium]